MGLARYIWLECRCRAPKIPMPHNCGKGHQSDPSLRHSRVQTSSSHQAQSHTNGQHCPWSDHSHIRLTQIPYHCMRQSTCCDKGAPPGHSTMVQNNIACTDDSAPYHYSTQKHNTVLYTAPYTPSPQRQTPRCTSKGGHSEA